MPVLPRELSELFILLAALRVCKRGSATVEDVRDVLSTRFLAGHAPARPGAKATGGRFHYASPPADTINVLLRDMSVDKLICTVLIQQCAAFFVENIPGADTP